MKSLESLERGRAYLDEATENLTFDEYLWAFEEVWRGVAWVLNAMQEEPSSDLGLGPKGCLVPSGSLERLAAPLNLGRSRVVSRLESLRQKLEAAEDLDIAVAVHHERIEQLVFDAWEVHDACGQKLGLVDERLGSKLLLTDVSPGKRGSQVIDRRTALKIFAVSSVVPLKACKKVDEDNQKPRAAASTPAQEVEERATVKRVSPLGGMQFETTDPFLFCAHHLDDYPEGNQKLGPDASLEGRHLGRDFDATNSWRMYHGREVPGFPRHPHRGFETVTFVRTGILDHSDSMGAVARYGGGDVQWLTAGGGIQHAEMFPLLKSESPNPLELFQIWMNLPAKSKMVDPHFTMLWSEDIPRPVLEDNQGKLVQLTIAAGAYGEHGPPAPPPDSWASDPNSDVAIWNIRLEAGARFEMPSVQSGTQRSLYVHQGGSVKVGDEEVPGKRRVELQGHGSILVQAGPEEVEILLLQGRPIGEPVAKRGPFVMNTQDEIRQAYRDYQRTQFGGWSWREGGPVHDGDKGRFARHIDGTYEEPT